MVEVMTKNQAREFMVSGLSKVEKDLFKVLDVWREKIMLVEERIEWIERRMKENE